MFKFSLKTMYKPEEIKKLLLSVTDTSKQTFLPKNEVGQPKPYRGEISADGFKLRAQQIIPGTGSYNLVGKINNNTYPTEISVNIKSTGALLFGLLLIVSLGLLLFMYINNNEIFTPIFLPVFFVLYIYLRLFISTIMENRRMKKLLVK